MTNADTPVVVVVSAVWATITTPQQLPIQTGKALLEELRYRPDGYDKQYKYQRGLWDGFNSVFDTRHRRVRRGLTSRLVAVLEAQGHPVTVVRDVPNAGRTVDLSVRYGSKQPREYQERVRQVVQEHDVGIISSPTGTGKTLMTALMLETLGKRAVIMLNDLVLLDQTQHELQEMLGIKVGMIGDGEFDLRDITVATVQSLRSILTSDEKKGKKIPKISPKRAPLMAFLDYIQVVIHDEVHLADSVGVAKLYPYFVAAENVYGLSATPMGLSRDENLEQEQHFGKVVYDTVQAGYNFIELNARAPVLVEVVKAPVVQQKYNEFQKMVPAGRRGGFRKVSDTAKNYAACLRNELIEHEAFHKLVAAKVQEYSAAGLSNYIFAPHSLEYLEKICEAIPGSIPVTGATSREERRTIFRSLNDKTILCVVSDIGSVGLNIPALEVLHNVSDYKDVRQLVGRVARAYPGKRAGIFVDYHHPTQFMHNHYKLRLQQYRSLGCIVIGDFDKADAAPSVNYSFFGGGPPGGED